MKTILSKDVAKRTVGDACRVASFRVLPLVFACFSVQQAQAVDLAGIIRDAVKNYPTVTQAQIQVESAEAQTNQYKLLHMPTFGVQSTRTSPLFSSTYSTTLSGKLNLYSGGSIEERVRMSKYNEQFQSYKVDETAEELAYSISQIYLSGLATKEQIASAQNNFNRHQKVIDDLKIIAQYDQGRRSDLIQAQSRQLQVQTRILQLESDLRTAESKLQKYLVRSDKIDWVPLSNIEKISTDYSQHPSLLAQYAEEQRAESQAKMTKMERRPTLDLNMLGGSNPTAYLAANWNFFDLSKGAGQTVADNELRTAHAKTEDVRRSIDERVSTSKIEADRALLTIQSTKNQVEAAKEVANAYEQQFLIARRGILDVLNAYSELSNIESAVISAQAVYRQSLVSGKYAAGQLVQWALHPPVSDAGTSVTVNNSSNDRSDIMGIDRANTSVKGASTIYPNVSEPSKNVKSPQSTLSAQMGTRQNVTTNEVVYPNVSEPAHVKSGSYKREVSQERTLPPSAAVPNKMKTVKPTESYASDKVYPNVDVPKVKIAVKPMVATPVEKVYPNVEAPTSYLNKRGKVSSQTVYPKATDLTKKAVSELPPTSSHVAEDRFQVMPVQKSTVAVTELAPSAQNSNRFQQSPSPAASVKKASDAAVDSNRFIIEKQ